ncbi:MULTISPECIES: RimK/LysX family protein [Pseudomonas]|uniref:ATP-dependent zinc protease family protein n=1 Tax=Pseudomonas TaxID=286 RepID=UPI0023D807CA|nr:RimK/LysX family protein [Pseudomonas sp. PSE14]WEJ72728.1 RimK/LysX family protein [Pseudomonas sp. PSE14]
MSSPVLRLLVLGLFAFTGTCAIAADEPAQPVQPAQPSTWGWTETIKLMPEETALKARLDTGAQTSTMDARNITRIKKNNERWVQYDVMVTDPATGKELRLPFERKIERVLKFHSANGVERSPVVLMDVCLGNKVYREQFSLRDRQAQEFPVLLGRRSLEHMGTVDSSKTQTLAPSCKP